MGIMTSLLKNRFLDRFLNRRLDRLLANRRGGGHLLALGLLALAGCASVEPRAPHISRLPESEISAAVVPVPPLPLSRVVEMSREGTPASTIIQALRDSRASFRISIEEARELSSQGVAYEVVEYLRRGEPRVAPVYPPPPRTYPSYVYVPSFYLGYSHWPRVGYPYYPYPPRSGVYFRFGVRR